MKKKERELSIKQKRFCEYYIISGNATDAGIKAGYSEKYIGTNTDKLLKNTKIQEYIEELIKQEENKRIADGKEVLEYLTSVMRGESTTQVLTGERDEKGNYIYAPRKPAEKERLKASEMLAKRYGLLTEKIELSTDENVINVNLIED